MHTCDDEAIALYINGDLTAAEQQGVVEHLATCARCRELAATLQEDARAVAGLAAATDGPALSWAPTALPVPGRSGARRVPPRRWIPVVAAALVVALLLPAWGPALADGVKQAIHWLTVKRLIQPEVDAWAESVLRLDKAGEATGRSVMPILRTTDPAEAERVAGYPRLVPAYMPEGYQLAEVWVWAASGQAKMPAIQQIYRQVDRLGLIEISQVPMEGPAGQVTAPAEFIREVTVGDGKGLIVQGTLAAGSPGGWRRDSGPITLRVDIGGQVVRIVSDALLPDEELIRVAESLQ